MGSHNLTSIIMGAVLGTLGLGSMASCGYSALCCVGTTVCSRICCASCPNIKNSTVTRIVYAILMFLLTIAAWIMMDDNISSKLLKLNKYTGSDKTDPADICNLYQVPVANCTSGAGGTVNKLWGEQGVSRVMFSGTCFFFLMGCMMVGASSSSGGRGTLQNGLWGIKILMIAAIAVGAFFIPNVFFAKTWAYIGLVGGFLWTLAQLVLIIDFAYSWADSWVGKIEEGSNCYKWLTILCSLGMYIGSLTMIIIMFVFYGKPRDPTTDASCGQNKAYCCQPCSCCWDHGDCAQRSSAGSNPELWLASGWCCCLVRYVLHLVCRLRERPSLHPVLDEDLRAHCHRCGCIVSLCCGGVRITPNKPRILRGQTGDEQQR